MHAIEYYVAIKRIEALTYASYNRVSFKNMMPSERSQTPKPMDHVILFIGNVQNRQIYADGKQISSLPGMGVLWGDR